VRLHHDLEVTARDAAVAQDELAGLVAADVVGAGGEAQDLALIGAGHHHEARALGHGRELARALIRRR